ncbi:Ger(x)C family spore germination protein [Salibacterium salarium]|uniref:Ger(X)C family spore germination protein n=1 Tax=Salibacterium salarium TaxID=284579 RepID=A0A3R9WS12_9BACI|nr:Ger(x)C family spore germination protein [Salibacterium salarium]RSL32344.1 Ger(x)C family spore germination protein [Salibacterium salarium]
MKIKHLAMSAMFVSMIFLSGCWSNQELPDLAMVSAIGIDQTENGKYAVTIQVINPGNVAGEGKQGAGGSESPPVTTYTETGDNLVEISRKASTKMSRQLYYAHANLIVIGEKLAKEEGVRKLFDALERDPEFRTTANIVIAHKSRASDIVDTLTSLDKIPSNKIIKTLKTTEKAWGEHLVVETREVLSKLVSPGQNPVITSFGMVGDSGKGDTIESIQATNPQSRLEANGLAVFKEGQMIEVMKGEAAKGLIWVLDKIQSTAVSVDWKEEKEAVVYQAVRQHTSVAADVQDNTKMKVSVEVEAEGDIGEVQVPVDLKDPHIIMELEALAEKEIKKSIISSINQAKELQTDILGFGEAVYRANPDVWKEVKQDWDETYFPEIEVDVTVDAFIRRTGLRNEPFLSNLES